MKGLTGLAVVNIELTSRCNKSCWMCGRRRIDEEYPSLALQYGDMSFDIIDKIAKQIPPLTIVQFHNNGEPLLYPELGNALTRFKHTIRTFDTNGKLLLEKADEIIDNVNTLTVSVIENDPEEDEQYEIVKKFLEIKGERAPRMIYRLLGVIEKPLRWHTIPGTVATRTLHSPFGSFNYRKKVTIPEHGICLDLISHLVIDRWGDVYPCVRFNPHKYNKLGNVKYQSLEEMWWSCDRMMLVTDHIEGNRHKNKLCSKCEYWGCPTS